MPTSDSSAAGAAIAETVTLVISLTEELAEALTALSGSRRTLIVQDPHSAWHRLVEDLIRDVHARLNAASTTRPLGTRAVARAAGVPPHSVTNACSRGEVRAERSDSGEYQVDPEDVARWMDSL